MTSSSVSQSNSPDIVATMDGVEIPVKGTPSLPVIAFVNIVFRAQVDHVGVRHAEVYGGRFLDDIKT